MVSLYETYYIANEMVEACVFFRGSSSTIKVTYII